MSEDIKTLNGPTDWRNRIIQKRIRARYVKDRLFRQAGLAALLLAGLFLAFLVGVVAVRGLPGFIRTEILLSVDLNADIIGSIDQLGPAERREQLLLVGWSTLVREAMQHQFPDVKDGPDLRALLKLVSRAGSEDMLSRYAFDNPGIVGQRVEIWVPASDDVDQFHKGTISVSTPEDQRPIKDRDIAWLDRLDADKRLRSSFNTPFFTSGASRYPEQAGIWGAVAGSFLTLAVTLLIAFPIGVFTAIYLEEFAPKNRLTDLIEVNINNLAAVPSIVFGLLGLAVFLNTFELPRSAPLVGGLTLALMTLPTIIIAARAAIKAVPQSIRDAARGLGASPTQVVFHHVVPLAMPGILTGTIIGMAQALGETAPLLMIGMVAFVVDIPAGITDPATALPVQIFIWSDFPERGFSEKTAAAIIVLLVFLMMMNALAIYLRNRFEKQL